MARVIHKIDLNSASEKYLTQLPGIAENLARRIVERRKRHNGFRSWEALLEVHGLGEARLAKIRQVATLGRRQPTVRPRFVK